MDTILRRVSVLFFLFAAPAVAQFTIVSGTIKDPSGIPYAQGSMSVTLTLPVGAIGAYLNGAQIGGSAGPVSLDSTGSFLIRLADNTQVQCATAAGQLVACSPQTQWKFSANSNGAPPPLGTGPQTCTTTVTVSGISQTLTISTCPALSTLGPTTSSGNGPVPGPPVFNVKASGAKGALKTSFNGTVSNNLLTVTCTDCNFSTNAAPGDTICSSVPNNLDLCSSIATITNNTTVQTVAPISSQNNTGLLEWGTFAGTAAASYDDAAVGIALTGALAAAKNIQALAAPGNLTVISAAPTVYFPAGHYLLCTQTLRDPGDTLSGFQIAGDGQFDSIVSWAPNCTVTQGSLVQATGSNTRIHDIEFDALNGSVLGSPSTIIFGGGGQLQLDNVIACCTANLHGIFSNARIFAYNSLAFGAQNGTGILCVACSGEWRGGGSSNNGINLSVQNTFALNAGQGFRMFGALIDETGGNCPTQFSNAVDVWLSGTAFFGTNSNYAVCITNNSDIHQIGGLNGSFGNDTNSGGISIDSSSVLSQSSVRNVTTGPRPCIANSGTVLNNGENTCESMFTIASGTSAGTTASLTVNTLGANLNTRCAVGDTAFVQGANVVGYNGKSKFGITAVGATTVSYTTVGSNLGALPAGGTFYCWNNRNSSGTQPTQTLAPSQFNCNIPTLTATTTTATTNCFFTPDRDILVTRFSTGLGTTPAGCTTAAVLQITNGTNSTNLTLPNGSAQDDSGSITAVLMAANTKIGVIVSTAAAGCTTSPANAALNFFWQAALDN